ncbi:hypothetical protein [Neisseria animaloris]|uniref:hypothetical protein n=1 Tax=Neisseria animaloris TaxID=326522 RepID=UPI0039E1B62C
MNQWEDYDYLSTYAESGHSFTIYDAEEELAKEERERDKEIIYVYPKERKQEKTISEQQLSEIERNLKESREMREKAKRLRDEAQQEKNEAERLKREHKKTLDRHMKKVSKQLEIVENDNKQLRESLTSSNEKLAQARDELKIYESMKHTMPNGDVVILENEIVAKLKAESAKLIEENAKLKAENSKIKAENAAKPRKTFQPAITETKRRTRGWRRLKEAALEAVKEKQQIKELNKRAAELRHKKTNELKEQAIQEYKESGLSKNQFTKQYAAKYHVSEATMRKNWLQGID